MNSLPYGSLSPTIPFSKTPDQTEVLERGQVQFVLSEAKKFVSLYDDVDDALMLLLCNGVLNQLELYTGIHSRRCVVKSEWLFPENTIDLPFGPHGAVTLVERWDGSQWIASESYAVVGLNFKKVRIHDRRPIRVTFQSGTQTAPPEIISAVYQEVAFRYKNRNDPQVVAAESSRGLSLIAKESIRLINRTFLRYAD